MSRQNGTSENFRCRRNGSRRNGTNHRQMGVGEMGVGEIGKNHLNNLWEYSNPDFGIHCHP